MGNSHPHKNPPCRASWPIEQLPGLTPADLEQLQSCEISSTAQLLQRTQILPKRRALAIRMQLHPQRLNKWIALASLAQAPAIGCDYCGLLLHAGIASLPQLAATPVPRLHQQMLRLQVSMMQRPDLCPSLGLVAQWVEQARSLTGSA
jgi:Domain of unknown function (DUF4332)